jgi:hypothetical protein
LGLQINPANLALQANFTPIFDVRYDPTVFGFVGRRGSLKCLGPNDWQSDPVTQHAAAKGSHVTLVA